MFCLGEERGKKEGCSSLQAAGSKRMHSVDPDRADSFSVLS